MATAVQATASTPAATTQTTGRAAGMGGDFNTFLTLLTTQLKNQDPTKAMDAQQMTAQFAQVEQAISMNGNMSKLIGLQQAAQLTAAAPLMGKTVEVSADRLSLQDGRATLRLPAAGAAREAQIAVLDAAGKTVRVATVPLSAAPTEWVWDGLDTAGKRQPDGAYAYAFAVDGRDAGGGAVPVEATVRARATAAERAAGANGGDLKLRLGGLSVGFDAVRSVDGS